MLSAALLLTLLAGSIGPRVLPAQRALTSLEVALPDSFPTPRAIALIVRSGSTSRTTVVLNRALATPASLGEVLATAQRLNRRPIGATATQVMTVTYVAAPRPYSSAKVSSLTSALSRLQAAPTTQLGNLGKGQWIRLDLADIPAR